MTKKVAQHFTSGKYIITNENLKTSEIPTKEMTTGQPHGKNQAKFVNLHYRCWILT